jgi:hypothetical protein
MVGGVLLLKRNKEYVLTFILLAQILVDKLRGPIQKSAESCGTRIYVQLGRN